MDAPAGLLERWCAAAREALADGFAKAGCGQPIHEDIQAWRSRALPLHENCLRSCHGLGDSVLAGLLGAFESARAEVERALHLATKSVIEWSQLREQPLAARERAARAIDRLAAFAPALQAALPKGAVAQTELISVCVALQQFLVSSKTLERAVADGRLTDHRAARHARNAPLRLDPAEVARHWPRRRGQNAVALGQSEDTPSPRPIHG